MIDQPLPRRRLLGAVIVSGTIAGCLGGNDEDPDDESVDDDDDNENENDDDPDEPVSYTVETVVDGLTHPWVVEPIPESADLLVTELSGELNRINGDAGSTTTIGGTPTVYAEGQGGLLDVAVHRDYPDDPWIYLTYAAANDQGESATHLGRGRLDPDATELMDFEVIHVAEPFVDSTAHYGSRIVVDDDGMLYMTSGDRHFKDFGPDHVSQDTENEIGTTLRLTPDGSIPDDNPFVDEDGVVDSIYSYGHRNAQGMTIHPETGELWQSEHGEEDGDELNVIEAGENYGWPIASYSCEYGSDEPVGDRPDERDDLVEPVYYWECNTGGFPPAGMTFYDGDAVPAWEGDLFVGNLAGQYLGHFAVDTHTVTELDPLLDDRGWRIRDVAVDPERGGLLVAVDDADAPLVRLVPENS